MDDPVTVTLEGTTRAAAFAPGGTAELTWPVGLRISSIDSAVHHGSGD